MSKVDIRCLACSISIYIVLEDYRRKTHRWDWDRQLCGQCSKLIPQHIPEEQFWKYKLAYLRLNGQHSWIGV